MKERKVEQKTPNTLHNVERQHTRKFRATLDIKKTPTRWRRATLL